MDQLNITLAVIGGLVLFLGLISDWMRRTWWTSDPMAGLILGILLSPLVFGLLDPTQWGISHYVIVREATRVTLAIGLMGVALRLPKNYFLTNKKPLAILLGLVMPLMWVSSGLLVYWILQIPFWEAMLVGGVVTPTDPIVASSIVTGPVAKQNLPERIRHIISAESGANDGLAYPFVFLPLLLLTKPSSTEALSEWFFKVVLWEVGGAVLLGIVFGYAAGRLLEWAESKKTIEETSFLGYTIALSLVMLGLGKLIGTDGILAVFVAGLAFREVIKGKERAEEENVQEAINRFFTLPIFILLGLVLPFEQWLTLGWRGLLLVVAILLLRRLPAIFVLSPLMKPLRNRADILFVSWFGPIAIAALYYASLSLERTGIEEVWAVGTLVICASIFVHGLTSTPGTRWYGTLTSY
ncbi:sodium/hydrogen exchanger [Gloeothece citriformis PCC 7424]|uniref:Sodium/hydrogen exchanger n=1 Tax=Gloeothece citriformis (strain PCC 7424) TaxID=65393 RepID=B7KES3_GLOC7|nr:cation:proton antiporter [Gloeothece citriformis]ACK69098.1 sodium/hydrogen exchanger [Gloeothece citriformis PCC 7424]